MKFTERAPTRRAGRWGLVGRGLLTTVVAVGATLAATGAVSSAAVRPAAAAHSHQAGGAVVTHSRLSASTTTTTTTNGSIEVCKIAGDKWVHGAFWFTINNSSGFSAAQSVPTGSCTGDISVPAGSVTVREAANAPYYLGQVWVAPAGYIVSSDLALRKVVFNVVAGQNTTGFFRNYTSTGSVKTCKTLTAHSGALVGMTFSYHLSYSWGGITYGPWKQSVVAPPIGQTACSLPSGPIPVGAVVSVTEDQQNPGNTKVTGIADNPASSNGGYSLSGASARVIVAGNGVVTATTFTNEAMGWVEICKYTYNPTFDQTTANQTFSFSVNGGSTIRVHTGYCSAPVQVPAGTASVKEFAMLNFSLAMVAASNPADPTVSRLLSSPTANPATVAVPWGGIGNETIVSFWNSVNQGDFKICTQQTSPDANLQGRQFTYTWSYTYNGTAHSGSVTLTEPYSGATCSGLIGPVPVMNPDGSLVDVTVTSVPSSDPSVVVTNIDYQGNGSVDAVNVPLGTMTYDIGYGMNVTTFTNGRT